MAGKSGSCGAEPEEYSAGSGIWAGNLCGRSLLRSPGGASSYPCPAIAVYRSKNNHPRLVAHAKPEECDKEEFEGVPSRCISLVCPASTTRTGRGWLVVIKKWTEMLPTHFRPVGGGNCVGVTHRQIIADNTADSNDGTGSSLCDMERFDAFTFTAAVGVVRITAASGEPVLCKA